MENFSFSALLGDARTLLFSLGVLAGSALIGIFVYLVLFAFFSRLLRNSISTLRLMLLKQMRPQARYLPPLLALDRLFAEKLSAIAAYAPRHRDAFLQAACGAASFRVAAEQLRLAGT